MTKYTTKIFVQNVIAFDFAILSKTLGLVGKSLSLDIAFDGQKKSNGMVVDFSIVKTIVKSLVETFDHKLLVTRNHVKFKTNSTVIVSQQFKTNSFFAMSSKSSWVQIVSPSILNSLETNHFARFETLLEKVILAKMPKNIKRVYVKLNENETGVHKFWYTHTLCKHEGQCQRFHGHSAQVQVYQNKTLDGELSNEIAKNLNGLYIIAKQNLRPSYNSTQLQKIKKYCFSEKAFANMKDHLNALQYQGSQGSVAIVVSKNCSLLLENESTVENIAEYIRSQIPLKGVDICVYEGLNKGAVVS